MLQSRGLMLCRIASKHEVRNSWQSGKGTENTNHCCCYSSAEGLALGCVFVTDCICSEDFSSWPALKQSWFKLCVSDFEPLPLTADAALGTSVLGYMMPKNSYSLVFEAFGCSSCTHGKLCRAGAGQGLCRRWQEQADGCHTRNVEPDLQQVRWTNNGVSFPLEMNSAYHLCCVRKTSKYKPCHKTSFQLFDYPEPFWCR